MAEKIDLSVVIVSFNTRKLLSSCLKSVKKFTRGITFEIIVVDNASSDGSAQEAEELRVKVIRNTKNLGFGQANNQGMKVSSGKYILLLNSDTEIKSNVLREMVGWMDKNKEVGISSCALKFGDGKLQATGGFFPTLGRVIAWMLFVDDIPLINKLFRSYHPHTDFYKTQREMDWLTGAFLMLRRDVYENTGEFDRDYFMYVEEVDYCFKAKKRGWKVVYNPKWEIIHFGGASSGKELSLLKEVEGIKIFYRKHYPAWQYLPLRLILKLGAFLRIFLFGKTYAKIFITA